MNDTSHATLPSQDEADSTERVLREKILHILKIYPRLGPSMLQVGIGTGLMPVLWHPVLERLIIDGLVSKRQITVQNPSGRSQVYTIIELVQEAKTN